MVKLHTTSGKGFAAPLARIVAAGLVIAGLAATRSAIGAPAVFTFADGTRVDGTSTAFDTPGPLGSYMTVDGITLTTVGFSAPKYIDEGSNNYSWDGTTFVNELSPTSPTNERPNTNFPGGQGPNHIGISNPTIPGTSDSNNFNPQESWTVKFDHDIIFRLLDANAIGGTDTMRVTFGTETFDFVELDFDNSDDIVDPFDFDRVIPANTHITFLNSQVYGTAPITLTGTNPSAGDAWGLRGFTVEVPVTGVPGDYNGDAFVDAADYVVWRKNLDGPEDSLLNRDPNNSGNINQGDYDFWSEHFGTPVSEEALSTVTATVPEPSAWLLTAIALVGLGTVRPCKRR